MTSFANPEVDDGRPRRSWIAGKGRRNDFLKHPGPFQSVLNPAKELQKRFLVLIKPNSKKRNSCRTHIIIILVGGGTKFVGVYARVSTLASNSKYILHTEFAISIWHTRVASEYPLENISENWKFPCIFTKRHFLGRKFVWEGGRNKINLGNIIFIRRAIRFKRIC